MKIRWNGHSSFTLTAADGLVIITDPYETGAFGGGIGYQAIDTQPDIVTISHEHADHNYIKGFTGKFVTLREAGEARGLSFRTVKAYHDRNKGQQRGEIRIFIFTVDGIRFCHLGDLGDVLSDSQINAIGKIDVLFVPVGGFYTIDQLQARDAVERLDPKIVIPMHYKTDKCGFPIASVADFLKGQPNVRHIEADEIEITAEKLPGAREIIVLRHHY